MGGGARGTPFRGQRASNTGEQRGGPRCPFTTSTGRREGSSEITDARRPPNSRPRSGKHFRRAARGVIAPAEVAVKALVAGAAATMFYARFRLPFALLPVAGSLVVAIVARRPLAVRYVETHCGCKDPEAAGEEDQRLHVAPRGSADRSAAELDTLAVDVAEVPPQAMLVVGKRAPPAISPGSL